MNTFSQEAHDLAADYIADHEGQDEKTRALHVDRLAAQIQQAIEDYLESNTLDDDTLGPADDGIALSPTETASDHLGRVSAVCICGCRRDSHLVDRIGYKPNPCLSCAKCRQFEQDTLDRRAQRAQ